MFNFKQQYKFEDQKMAVSFEKVVNLTFYQSLKNYKKNFSPTTKFEIRLQNTINNAPDHPFPLNSFIFVISTIHESNIHFLFHLLVVTFV